MKQCLQSVNHEQFPIQMTQQKSTTSGWKSSIFNRNSSGERRLKFIASWEDEDNKKPRAKHREHGLAHKATSSTQRPQTWTEAATKYYNYTANGADEEKEHLLPTLRKAEKAMGRSGNAYSLQQNYLLWCTDRQQQLHDLYNAREEYLSNGLRTCVCKLRKRTADAGK